MRRIPSRCLLAAALSFGLALPAQAQRVTYGPLSGAALASVLGLTPAPDWSHGFTPSANVAAPTTTVDLAPGACTDDGGTITIASGSTLTVNFGTTGAGGLDAGAPAASSWYANYAIYNPTTQATSAVATLASTPFDYGTPSLPAGYTYKCYIGRVKTNASAQPSIYLSYGQWYADVAGSYSYTPSPGALGVSYVLHSGGGSGGSGGCNTSGSAVSGAGGGGGGARRFGYAPLAMFGAAPITVVVGVGGAAPAPPACAAATAGTVGAVGGSTSIGALDIIFPGGAGQGSALAANSSGGGGGGPGLAGSNGAAGTGGAGGIAGGTGCSGTTATGMHSASAGGGGCAAGSGGGGGIASGIGGGGASGGAGGGGVSTVPAASAGGNAGVSMSGKTCGAGGAAGSPGTSVTLTDLLEGCGGGGGGSATAAAGGNGGAGTRGGGGGGGGAVLNGQTPGEGGAGGAGFVYIQEQFS